MNDERTWYIDSLDPRAGLVFASARPHWEPGHDFPGAQRTVFIAPPNFSPRVVSSHAIALGASRSRSQIRLMSRDQEIGFRGLESVRDFVRRVYSGSAGGDGPLGSAGVEPAPTPVLPLEGEGTPAKGLQKELTRSVADFDASSQGPVEKPWVPSDSSGAMADLPLDRVAEALTRDLLDPPAGFSSETRLAGLALAHMFADWERGNGLAETIIDRWHSRYWPHAWPNHLSQTRGGCSVLRALPSPQVEGLQQTSLLQWLCLTLSKPTRLLVHPAMIDLVCLCALVLHAKNNGPEPLHQQGDLVARALRWMNRNLPRYRQSDELESLIGSAPALRYQPSYKDSQLSRLGE